MGISSALYSGVSGLNTNATAMSVIGNNLANTNTVGFKSSSSVFSDLLSGTVSGSGGTSQVGRGVNLSSVSQTFSQGTFDTTESNLDVAIEGEGFFIVSPDYEDTDYYTRAGSFSFDSDGYLVNDQGYRVQGKLYDENGDLLPADAADIQIQSRGLVGGQISDEISLETNLDSGEDVMDVSAFDATDTSTYNYASSVEIYDSLGETHTLTLYFVRDENDTTSGDAIWQVYWSAEDVDGNALGSNGELGNSLGTLEFTSDGTLIDETILTLAQGDLVWGNGSASADIDVEFDTTQYNSSSTVLSVDQNGYGAGSMSSVEIDEDGNVIANYSNGVQKKIAALALAKFVNPNGLESIGNNMYAETDDSGAPRIGLPDEELGTVYTNSLEQSNVDMGAEMVKMITLQRGYSANSKIITTIDEMMQEVINLK